MKKLIFVLLILGLGVLVFLRWPKEVPTEMKESPQKSEALESIVQTRISELQSNGIDVLVEGKSLRNFDFAVRMDDQAKLKVQDSFLEDIMGCSVLFYKDGKAVVDRAETEISFSSAELTREQTEENESKKKNETVLFPVSEHLSKLGYSVTYDMVKGTVNFTNTDGGKNLPAKYDMRDHDRVSPIRDQGTYGTCWAFASLAALETVSMPAEENIYSVDHMSLNNGFTLDLSEGGEHTMSLAYLASWNGPVLEENDVYGDGETDSSLPAVKHLKEAIIIDGKDDDRIKNAVFKYGGVETSIHMEMTYGAYTSEYYNSDNSSYYYSGDEAPNHDLVIVGWDDNYPKENFSTAPAKDGAYICKNSWGTSFGEEGYFYVSYEDTNICQKSIVYTKLDETDDYDNIYQTDLLGWVGQMGFSDEKAYFANVYTAQGDETLKAISFYSTGSNTKFSVYIVTDYKDEKSLNGGRKEIGKGETRYAGYYTVDLSQEINLEKGQKYAIIMSVETPGSQRPIAIECDGGERTQNLDLSDGEGYISLYGEVWYSAEESDANVCLKAFTDDR